MGRSIRRRCSAPCAGLRATGARQGRRIRRGRTNFGLSAAPSGPAPRRRRCGRWRARSAAGSEVDAVAADGLSRARSRVAKRAPGSFDPTPAAPEYWPRPPSHELITLRARPSQGAIRARTVSGQWRFSAKCLCCDRVNATRSSSASPERDLAAHGIGLVASPGEAAKAAEAMLRRRYSWAEEDAAQTLVALGGDGFMLQTLHAMLEEGRQGRCSG